MTPGARRPRRSPTLAQTDTARSRTSPSLARRGSAPARTIADARGNAGDGAAATMAGMDVPSDRRPAPDSLAEPGSRAGLRHTSWRDGDRAERRRRTAGHFDRKATSHAVMAWMWAVGAGIGLVVGATPLTIALGVLAGFHTLFAAYCRRRAARGDEWTPPSRD